MARESQVRASSVRVIITSSPTAHSTTQRNGRTDASDLVCSSQVLDGHYLGVRPWLVPGPVFKTGEGSGNRLLVGSIPMRSRHAVTPRVFVFAEGPLSRRGGLTSGTGYPP